MLPLVRSLQLADMLPCIAFHMTRDNVTRFAKAMENQLRKEEEIAQEKEVCTFSKVASIVASCCNGNCVG
jgi:hypothetical protein